MKILRGKRGSGKTTELIKLSNKGWKYIVCAGRKRVENITSMAMDMGIAIPHPITISELPLSSPYIKDVLVDDVEDVLSYLIGKPVSVATTSCEVEEVKLPSKPKKLESGYRLITFTDFCHVLVIWGESTTSDVTFPIAIPEGYLQLFVQTDTELPVGKINTKGFHLYEFSGESFIYTVTAILSSDAVSKGELIWKEENSKSSLEK